MESSSSSRAWTLVACLLLLLCVPGDGKPFRKWSPGVFPNPLQDVYDCGREGRKSSLCDPENILSKESQDMVDGLINEIAEGTPPFRSAQCGSLGQKGFQVWKGQAAAGQASRACMHEYTAIHKSGSVFQHATMHTDGSYLPVHSWQRTTAAARSSTSLAQCTVWHCHATHKNIKTHSIVV
jgi:hypothetical protein